MSDKVITIISSGDIGKALTGLGYATRAVQNKWLSEVKLCFMGAAEQLLVDNEDIQNMVNEFKSLKGDVVACKAIADRYAVSDKISALDIDVEFVGQLISDHIKDGYVPMVW